MRFGFSDNDNSKLGSSLSSSPCAVAERTRNMRMEWMRREQGIVWLVDWQEGRERDGGTVKRISPGIWTFVLRMTQKPQMSL
ncbi:hypothetical protein Nepgr_016294 [Nepenthes gracilis]|uniref:Uncharacterized protein n=1 Tax=Nepenthes gracilis TaxID=150966 RepID=A0AAD3SNA3_NEPGR|nr:hypothetical protein Nepgr_016294 [Nepenthes gracilis]